MRVQRASRTASRQLLLSVFGMAAAAVLASAGCGRVAKSGPEVGGESHFLHWCSGSCEEEDLQCISGLCTRPCVLAEANACSAFNGAICTAASIEPGAAAVCDVRCGRDEDCAVLGDDYRCAASFCRSAESPRGGSSGSAGIGGSSPSGSEEPPPSGLGGAGGTGTAGNACVGCFDGPSLSWKWNGGLLAQMPASFLASCNRYQHQLAPVGADDPLGSPQCSTLVDGCPSDGLAVLNATLQNPDVQAGLQAHTVFGNDGRAGDGVVREITLGSDSLFVGPPCFVGNPACIAIPASVDLLITQLQALDALELSKDACASVFPNGFNF